MKKYAKWAAGSMLTAGLVTALGTGPATAASSASSATSASSTPAPVTKYYNGKTYILTPGNWHGAKDCAIDSPTVAHCFDTDEQFAAYTNSTSTSSSTPPASSATTASSVPVTPNAPQPPPTGDCDGWAKIWSDIHWQGKGLAFHDWGPKQSLSTWVKTPWTMKSWWTDGHASGYPALTNCTAVATSPDSVTLKPVSNNYDMGAGKRVSFIELTQK